MTLQYHLSSPLVIMCNILNIMFSILSLQYYHAALPFISMCNIRNILYIMWNTSSYQYYYYYYYHFVTQLFLRTEYPIFPIFLYFTYIFILLQGLYNCKSVILFVIFCCLFLCCLILSLRNLAQEFPSASIKFYLISSLILRSACWPMPRRSGVPGGRRSAGYPPPPPRGR